MHIPRLLIILVAGLMSACISQVAHADIITYDVTGYIDTYDFLMISGSTLQWHHSDTGGAAVGRHGGNNFPTVISATLNGVPQMSAVDWTPDWPSPVPAEIRYDAVSSIFNTLTPALPPTTNITVQTSVISGRGSIDLVRLPIALNNYTLIVEFKDGFDGSANLDALITITTPEPATVGMLSAGIFLLGSCRRSARK